MKNDHSDNRISKITTNWDELIAAHRETSAAAEARGKILTRYALCAHKYLLGVTRDEHVAGDLAQEFALRFVRGDFRNASPQRGRFRDYLKASLRNLVKDHFRQKASEAVMSPQSMSKIEDDGYSMEPEFSNHWRQRILAYSWDALKSYEQSRGNHYYSVLHLRAKHPDASSCELADLFFSLDGKQVKPEWIRQNLTRARKKFGEFVLEEVGRTIDSKEKSDILEELADLGLQKYVDNL